MINEPELSLNKIPVNFDELSEKSKIGLGVPDYWEDHMELCRACHKEFLVTAIEQKQLYEVEKSIGTKKSFTAQSIEKRQSM